MKSGSKGHWPKSDRPSLADREAIITEVLEGDHRKISRESLRELRKTLVRELLFEDTWQPFDKRSPYLDILRQLGFTLPATRRRGGPRRNIGKNVGKCVLAAHLREWNMKVKDIANVLGLKADKDEYGKVGWSQSAKRYIDDGNDWLAAHKHRLLEIHSVTGDVVPELYLLQTSVAVWSEIHEEEDSFGLYIKYLESVSASMKETYLEWSKKHPAKHQEWVQLFLRGGVTKKGKNN